MSKALNNNNYIFDNYLKYNYINEPNCRTIAEFLKLYPQVS